MNWEPKEVERSTVDDAESFDPKYDSSVPAPVYEDAQSLGGHPHDDLPADQNGRMDTKPTNPKDAIGSTKLPLGLVPSTINAEVALAYLEGALKYGRYNWRIAGVRASIYNDALERHRSKWWNGENADRRTRVKHLASIIACAGILLDAELCGKLTDDRPPAAPVADLIDGYEERVKFLIDLFKDHHPHQYTIADTQGVPGE
jgi:hypothetical protein